ncbi:MAG TPA: cytochrome P450 [Nocardioidaceae bacterium]|nr:cytochrome P450 [Nocardioidaceae bacterium]
MGIVSRIRARVRRAILSRATAGGGLDLSKIDKVPESLSWPLNREGFDPVPRLAEVRETEPVHKLTTFFGITVWVVTGDAEAREVLADSTSYSNDIRPFVGDKSGSTTDGDIGGLGFTDPPDHTRLRKLLTPEFTMRRLDRLKPRIAEIIDECLDNVAAAGPDVDLVPTFAFPVPFQVICELLGLPVEDRETFRGLATARFDVSYGGAGALGAISGSREFLLDFAAQQRKNPGDGLVGQIIREHGDEISDFELGGLADGVFTGGLETSASMLALGTAVLLNHPDEYAALANGTADVDKVVDELLRYLSVVQIAFPRFAKHDLEVGGKRIGEGDVVICHLAGTNRDSALAGDDLSLEEFNPHRAMASSNLAFGHGFHRCVGAELAKIELRMAYPALAKRFPDLVLARTDLAYRQKSIVYGVDELPVRLAALATTP